MPNKTYLEVLPHSQSKHIRKMVQNAKHQRIIGKRKAHPPFNLNVCPKKAHRWSLQQALNN